MTGVPARAFRRALLNWYRSRRRDLPWRASTDFYRVWISEIMLQQTRVEAVIPYFNRFLTRFPDVTALAASEEDTVLAAWSGLGYYSRARNLHRAAKQVNARGFPRNYDELRALPGVGVYTAAAISSIVLGLPHAAVDGNAMRVISRLTNDASEISSAPARALFAAEAQRLLDPRAPGDFNQAMMDLGATVCAPRNPACGECPVAELCAARAAGRERELPVKRSKPAPADIVLELAAHFERGRIYLARRPDTEKRMAGFWELPAAPVSQRTVEISAEFTHRIVNDRFRVKVLKMAGRANGLPESGRFFAPEELNSLPVTTITRKSLAVLLRETGGKRSPSERKTAGER